MGKLFDHLPEGSTPLDDESGLKLRWIKNQDQLNKAEAENINIAYGKYLEGPRRSFPQWFNIKNVDLVHKTMFGKVWQWAGKYRRTEKSIGVSAYQISYQLKILEKDMEDWAQRNWDPVEVASKVHHRLVWIHPYENGNGRHGRFIGDMVLHSFKYAYPIWPKLAENGNERNIYITALKEADQGSFDLLMQYLVRHGAKKLAY
jgi:Fic-DOC domain mobile mystery protein B